MAQGLTQGMEMAGADPELAKFRPTFDPAEMLKLNQEAIVTLGRRKAGLE